MKKSLIAGAGVAAFAFAALPFAGVFADATVTTTDSLTLTVPKGCSIGTAANGGTDRSDTAAAFGSVAPTQTKEDSTSAIVVTCNSAWTLTPTIATALSNGTQTIASGTTLDGTASNWALKLDITDLAGTNSFFSYAAVDGNNKVTGTAAVTSLSITPTYKVSVAGNQATGEYTGSVLYTVAQTD